jgi:hypothetical protein
VCVLLHGWGEAVRVAALFVERGGCYWDLPGVDAWDVERDARLYAGPWPVIAHPPCERWGRYWSGGPSAKVRRKKGDDGGCFKAALDAVRRWGGILEHPEGSHAWRVFGLIAPPHDGGWVSAGDFIGWTCRVEQGHYGHRCPKGTWLYAAPLLPPALKWGPSDATGRIEDIWSNNPERAATPLPFRDLLLSIARSARAREVAA